jgi:hypothetical protein
MSESINSNWDANNPEVTGKLFNTQIPSLGDDSNIQEALKLFLYGTATSPQTSANIINESIAGYIKEIESDVVSLQALGIGSSLSDTRPTGVPDGYVWMDANTTSAVGVGNVAYLYDLESDTWTAMAGVANAATDYSWTADHSFSQTVTIDGAAIAKSGVNTFLNPLARDTAIPSPTNGVTCFVRQDATGFVINQLQYFFNGVWRIQGGNAHIYTTSEISYALSSGDSGKTILVNNGSANTISIPNSSSVSFAIGTQITFVQTGAGKSTFSGASGVTINSKYGNKSIALQYSPATIVCTADNEWLLIGDLTA